MTHYLKLDLNSITINPQLARQVPYALSRYYLVLPLGRENGAVSVAMAYPDNEKAQAHSGPPAASRKLCRCWPRREAIQRALERIHGPEEQPDHSILAWYEHPAWETAVSSDRRSSGKHIPHQSDHPACVRVKSGARC